MCQLRAKGPYRPGRDLEPRVIEASTALFPGWARRLEICGEHGSATLQDDQVTSWEFRVRMPGDDAVSAVRAPQNARSGASSPQISYQGHLLQIRDMVAALREGRAPAVDGRAGRNAVALIRAIYESAGSGMPCKLAT